MPLESTEIDSNAEYRIEFLLYVLYCFHFICCNLPSFVLKTNVKSYKDVNWNETKGWKAADFSLLRANEDEIYWTEDPCPRNWVRQKKSLSTYMLQAIRYRAQFYRFSAYLLEISIKWKILKLNFSSWESWEFCMAIVSKNWFLVVEEYFALKDWWNEVRVARKSGNIFSQFWLTSGCKQNNVRNRFFSTHIIVMLQPLKGRRKTQR